MFSEDLFDCEGNALALTKEKKNELVVQYTDMLKNSRALIVTDYRGLSTTELTGLRRNISEADGKYIIIKNRLFKLAMQNAGIELPEDFLDGPVAAGFCYGEVQSVAKALAEFAKESDFLVLKGGMMDEKFLNSAEMQALAELPPFEVIQAQLLGLFAAPASNIAGVMASGVRQVLSVISAYSEQEQSA